MKRFAQILPRLLERTPLRIYPWDFLYPGSYPLTVFFKRSSIHMPSITYAPPRGWLSRLGRVFYCPLERDRHGGRLEPKRGAVDFVFVNQLDNTLHQGLRVGVKDDAVIGAVALF